MTNQSPNPLTEPWANSSATKDDLYDAIIPV
jgi:hypothetical protein